MIFGEVRWRKGITHDLEGFCAGANNPARQTSWPTFTYVFWVCVRAPSLGLICQRAHTRSWAGSYAPTQRWLFRAGALADVGQQATEDHATPAVQLQHLAGESRQGLHLLVVVAALGCYFRRDRD